MLNSVIFPDFVLSTKYVLSNFDTGYSHNVVVNGQWLNIVGLNAVVLFGLKLYSIYIYWLLKSKIAISSANVVKDDVIRNNYIIILIVMIVYEVSKRKTLLLCNSESNVCPRGIYSGLKSSFN